MSDPMRQIPNDMPFGVQSCMTYSISVMVLSADQVKAFFKKLTPVDGALDGSRDVWDVFKARRSAANVDLDEDGEDNGYGFTDFVREVLADTGHPVRAQA